MWTWRSWRTSAPRSTPRANGRSPCRSASLPFGALIFYGLLYRQRLVPPWLSVWRLLAAALLFVGTIMILLDLLPGIPEATLEAVVAGPIAVNEMVLAAWLILKCFSPTPEAEARPETV